MSSIEIYNKINEHWGVFIENHERFNEKKVKAAGVRARKAIGEFKKLITDYRKLSVSESKN